MTKDKMDEHQLETFNGELVEKHIPDMIFVVLVCLVGIAGNSVTSTFFWNKMGRNVHSYLLTILSLNDLFTSFVLLDNLFDTVYAVTFTNEVGCKFIASANRCLIMSSFVLIFLIAVDRFLTIFLKNPRIMFSGRSAKMAVVAIYIFTVSTTVPDFIITEPIKVNITTARNETFAGYFCHRGESNDSDKHMLTKIYKSVELILVVFILVAIIVIYSLIACEVAKSKKRVMREKRQSNCVLNIDKNRRDGSNLNITEERGPTALEIIDDETDQNTDDVTVDEMSLDSINKPQVITKVDTIENMDILVQTIDETEQKTENVTVDEVAFKTIKKPQPITKVDTVDIMDIRIKTIIETEQRTENVTLDEVAFKTIHKPKIFTKVDTVKSMDVFAKPKRERSPKRKNPQSIKRDRNLERRITLAMLVMTLASVLTFVPYFIVELAVHEQQYEHSVWMRFLSRSYVLNSSINPFIIGYFNPQLRNYFKRIVQSMKVW